MNNRIFAGGHGGAAVPDRRRGGGNGEGPRRSRAATDVPAERVGGHGPVSVLVVDDSRMFRRGMVRAVEFCAGLSLAGEADGGTAALEAITRLQPDVVLLDLRMPDVDGLEVLARLRGLESARTPQVLLVSASLDEDVERHARAAGAAGCLSKAMSQADICAAVLDVARQ
ncbi:MAG: two-component system, NarL family, nitrate/nitrite response regulator NarL [Solirubrobacteraceae bacterium]|nr:two-component system, NarL family, nitrate/nitrite response regulator NarL [Solirubrobacteraceae bacterium]MEA2359902.1 two-component system, NarL family, nitrate/nitrite response regulator NarL [Solirubrobacteraceae bacterium]